ncbi:MAG: hypothetical protein AAF449_16100 [Myxococcota bacterium]
MPSENHRWLIVDDDESMLEALQSCLAPWAQHCAYARTLREARILSVSRELLQHAIRKLAS